jgi:hypothetical protein
MKSARKYLELAATRMSKDAWPTPSPTSRPWFTFTNRFIVSNSPSFAGSAMTLANVSLISLMASRTGSTTAGSASCSTRTPATRLFVFFGTRVLVTTIRRGGIVLSKSILLGEFTYLRALPYLGSTKNPIVREAHQCK